MTRKKHLLSVEEREHNAASAEAEELAEEMAAAQAEAANSENVKSALKILEGSLSGIAPNGEGNPKFKDNFVLESEGWDSSFVKAVDLPKFIFRPTSRNQAVHEKSVLMTYLTVSSDTLKRGLYAKLAKAIRSNQISLSMTWFDDPAKNKGKRVPLSKWSFENARIQGIDLGNAALERSEPNVCTVEIVFDTITIDDVSF